MALKKPMRTMKTRGDRRLGSRLDQFVYIYRTSGGAAFFITRSWRQNQEEADPPPRPPSSPRRPCRRGEETFPGCSRFPLRWLCPAGPTRQGISVRLRCSCILVRFGNRRYMIKSSHTLHETTCNPWCVSLRHVWKPRLAKQL